MENRKQVESVVRNTGLSRYCVDFRFMAALRTWTRVFVLLALVAATATAQTQKTAHVRPINGSRMIVGDGEVADYTVQCFLHLCGEVAPDVAVIRLDGQPRITTAHLDQHGVSSVFVVDSINGDADPTALTEKLLAASGIWIEGEAESILANPLLMALLKNVTKRNGIIAVSSTAISVLEKLDENDQAKRLQSPFVKCDFHFGDLPATDSKADESTPVKVHFSIPDSSVLVIHGGRRIAGYGDKDVSLLVAGANGWPERRDTFECPDVFGPNSYPFYGRALLSWIRSANERRQPVFPVQDPASPVLENGTLFLHGGSRLKESVMQQFIKLVGGKEAPIVCIPSSRSFRWSETPESYSADLLIERGLSNVTVLHTSDPAFADESEAFAQLLNNAKGVWIDGGRTYRFMDCYQGTQVETLIANVLKRGGVVGGSSAGCQVPSDFLVRGNPRTNRSIVHEGYTRGMGLLKGVIIDAHFLQRGRHEPFLGLMKEHPQMLGIGIDENTAIIVQKNFARVVGPHAVSFYDLTADSGREFKPVILKAGQTYDLKSKAATKTDE